MTDAQPKELKPTIVVLKTGEKLITMLQEAFEGKGEEQRGVCLIMNHPYTLELINVENLDNPAQDLQVKYSRWCPFSIETQFRIPYDGVLSLGDPDPGLAQAYQAKVREAENLIGTAASEFAGVDGSSKSPAEKQAEADIAAAIGRPVAKDPQIDPAINPEVVG